MKTPSQNGADGGMEPLSPLFVCGIVFGGLVRILEIYILTISSIGGFYEAWLSPRIGRFGMGDLMVACAALFLILAVIGTASSQQKRKPLVPTLFCLLLLGYCAGLRFLPEALRTGTIPDGFPWRFLVEWLDFTTKP